MKVLITMCCKSTSILILALTASLVSAESYPLWDGQESVAAYAKKVNLPVTQSLELGNGVKLELVLIPAGTFIMGTQEPEKPIVGQAMVVVSGSALFAVMLIMVIRAGKNRTRLQFSMAIMLLLTFIASIGVWGGVRWNKALKSPSYDSNEFPPHPVTLTQPFYMGKYEVTQEQYQAVIGENRSDFKGKDNPVEMVSWDDAKAFCQKLSSLTSRTIRLPTEAEWEYACRAGTIANYHSGDSEADLNRVAWHDGNSNNKTNPVGQKQANTWGLYDMYGNVVELCEDKYGKYSAEPAINPSGANSGPSRVLRGGSWTFRPFTYRSAYRESIEPHGDLNYIGFRVVMQVPPNH